MTLNERKLLQVISILGAILVFSILVIFVATAQAATIDNGDGTFNVGSTTWIADGNVNYNSDDYSCLFNFGAPCSNQSVGLTNYDIAVLVADNTCAGCRLPTVEEYLALSRENLTFLTLVPDAVYWALDESGNPFLFGKPAVGLDTSTATRAVGLLGVMAVVDNNVAIVPIPAAIWLFGAGLLGLTGVARKR